MQTLKIFTLVLILLLWDACTNKQPNAQTHNKRVKIAIVSLGKTNQSIIDTLVLTAGKAYDADVYFLNSTEIPSRFFINIKSPRYRADSIIRYLRDVKPDSIDYVVGITGYDISTTSRDENGKIKKPESTYIDWGVFGLGYMPGKSCVVSTFRLKSNSEILLYERVKKVIIHELGHNMGLDHCPDKTCVMTDAVEKISTVDDASPGLCFRCKKLLE